MFQSKKNNNDDDIIINGLSISKKQLRKFILDYGLENLYVGYRVDDYSNYRIFGLEGLPMSFPEQKEAVVTLFKHCSTDENYYDILDYNKACSEINMNMIYMSHGCRNLSSLDSLINVDKYVKKIEKRGK